jgi:hypothetical protein
MTMSRGEDRQHDLRAMLRDVTQAGGVPRLLRRLAGEVDGWAVLLGRTGEPWYALPDLPTELLAEARETIASVTCQRHRSASVHGATHGIHAVSIDSETTLVVARRGAFAARAGTAIADAAALLQLQWRAEQAERRSREVAIAESFAREAVLHMLMVGHLDGARRSAGALRHELPDILRLYLIECVTGMRDEPARLCSDATEGQAWIIRCPVYRNHLIVLGSAAEEQRTAGLNAALSELAANRGDVCIGTGHAVPLRDTAIGYQQAFHALTIARSHPSRFAVFSASAELATLLGPAGGPWAHDTLAPLLGFVPERSQDPGSAELIRTLRSWLTFGGCATRRLKIHRNTLATRLRRIERILDCDLGELVTQTKLHLALRILGQQHECSGQTCAGFQTLLRSATARQWAEMVLSPLHDNGSLLITLRTWLQHNAHVEPTATALGLSVPGTRRRLVRIEELLGRSLLNSPSARYDLLIALRILDDDSAF